MADHTLKKLISLIAAGKNVEVRRAAVQIAGALKPSKEHALNRALLDVLTEEDVGLRGLAVEALGETRAEEALPALVGLVEKGGAEVEAAVKALGHLGVRGTKALGQVMHQAPPVLRRRIAAALTLVGTESAVLATAASLLDADPGVVEASARSLASEVPQLPDSQKRALAEHLLLMLQPTARSRKQREDSSRSLPKKNGSASSRPTGAARAPAAEAAILRVLAALHAPEAEEVYWARLGPHRPVALRCAALQALAALPPPASEAKLHHLLICAADADFQVVAPALMLLKKVPASRKNLKHWLGLFKAPDVAAHLLAVDKLREVDSPEVAKALLEQLHHPDKGLRNNAIAALRELKAGRDALFAGLFEAQSSDEAWTLARAQVKAAQNWTPLQRAKAFGQACKAHESDDRRADPLWFLLREIDVKGLLLQLQERALALRKKKNFASSLAYWRLLTRDPAVGPELRFELAATTLKLSNHDPSSTAREADQALHLFSRLLQDPAFDTIGHVAAAKWLEEDDLFYLGFHFAEQARLAREFGGLVLQVVIQRWPKLQVAKNAKRKLKSEGFSDSGRADSNR
jgi:HEAT repeat protein